MSSKHYALLRSAFDIGKKHDVVHVKEKKHTTVIYMKGKEFEIKFPQEILIKVPRVDIIHQELVKVVPTYGIMYSGATAKFYVVNLRLGKAVVHDVPVAADKSRRNIRLVDTPSIKGSTFDKCSVNLFRYLASGRLYETNEAHFSRVYWDEHAGEFRTKKVTDAEANARHEKH